jgi:hypothetical protein
MASNNNNETNDKLLAERIDASNNSDGLEGLSFAHPTTTDNNPMTLSPLSVGGSSPMGDDHKHLLPTLLTLDESAFVSNLAHPLSSVANFQEPNKQALPLLPPRHPAPPSLQDM